MRHSRCVRVRTCTLRNEAVTDEQLTPPAPLPFASERDSRAAPQQTAAAPMTQTIIVGLIFLVIGFISGGLVFGRSIDTVQLERSIRTIVAEEVANISTSGGSATADLTDNDPAFGPEDAKVTIVEFSDFYCSFCGRFANETLPRLRETYGDHIRFVYRDMPIIGGQISVQAAIAGNCAFAQDKFWDFHNIVFQNTDARSREAFISFADELGLDTEAFTTCLDDRTMSEEVTLDYIDGQSLGISGTPAFFINGRQISGAQPFDTFALVIDSELRKAGITPPERGESG